MQVDKTDESETSTVGPKQFSDFTLDDFGIIGMLEVITSDFDHLNTNTKLSEASAQEEDDEFIADSQAVDAKVATYNKTYKNDEVICNANMEKYGAHNADAPQTFIKSPNQFSDFTHNDWQISAYMNTTVKSVPPQLISLRSALTLVPARPSSLSEVQLRFRVRTNRPQTSCR